jgi:AcrR family transcriptional regulator
MLDAAREVFCERGYAEAAVAEVVRQAGSSVGSLYHHFGGKAELFLALWEDHRATLETGASRAVAEARRAGERNPLELFVIGTRAYLEGCWQRRDLTRLFMSGDAPTGFELVRRAPAREWLRQNAVLLGAGTGPLDRLTVAALTLLIGEASRELATSDGKAEADEVVEAAIVLIRRLDPLAGDR